MYYLESQRIEPWAPEISGVQPPDWKTTSVRDFNAAGLHPTSVGYDPRERLVSTADGHGGSFA